jgi:tetratricopeptide (TPR) repeat protein
MPLFAELLHSLGEASRGVYADGIAGTIKQVEGWQRSSAIRSWRAWAEAWCAFERGSISDCSNWLIAAENMSAAEPDFVRTGEIDLLWAELWDRADEPHRAIAHAQAAWKCWFALTQNPLETISSGTLRALLEALTYPDILRIDDGQLSLAWIRDRPIFNLHNSTDQIFRACRELKISLPALEVVAELRKSYSARTDKGELLPEETAPLVASLLQQVANLHDELQNPQFALEAFGEARSLLAALDPESTGEQLREIDFDIANQLAKAGRHTEAISEFQRLAEAFSAANEEEPYWRARHSILVSRWKLRAEPRTINEDLEELLIRYEDILARSSSWKDGNHTRQNLNVANDLWISVHAVRLDSALSKEHFLYQIFSNREGETSAHTLWNKAVNATATPEILTHMSVLTSRLADETGKLLVLSFESGVDELFAVTLRSGTMSLSERFEVERLDSACIEALTTAVLARRDATESIASGAIAMTASASLTFQANCRNLWNTLPQRTRELLSDASTIFFVPPPRGGLDEVPLELAHTGEEFLGLQKIIVRASSWRQLADSFARNRVDSTGFGRFAIVRGGDVPQFGELRMADAEVAAVAARATKAFENVEKLTSPSSVDLLETLNKGVDVLHFTGHSIADEAGERLILGPDSGLGVPELDVPRRTPAPVCIFCSCLIGLHRMTRQGSARGIATALLDGGSPAVVAAMVSLPDEIGHEFAVALHFHAKARSIGEAVRMSRVTLARRFHPASWACFALFGNPTAQISPKPDPMVAPWPALLIRCIATRGKAWQGELEAALAKDTNLDPKVRERALTLAGSCAREDADGALAVALKDLGRSLPVEGRLLLQGAELLVEATNSGKEETAAALLSKALSIQELTDDNYMLVAITHAGIESGVLLIQNDSTRSFVSRAMNKLGWLDRSEFALERSRVAIHEVRERWAEQISLIGSEVAGVSNSTFRAADTGDQDAQQELLWNLWSQKASLEAKTSELPWIEWLYRAMGLGCREADADLFGAVDAAARAGRISPRQAESVRTICKRHFLPGEIEMESFEEALRLFAEQPDEMTAIRLYQLYDKIVSQQNSVTREELTAGQAVAERAGAWGLVAFLYFQLAFEALAIHAIEDASTAIQEAMERFAMLVEVDALYQKRFNMCATFLFEVATRSGDLEFQDAVSMRYGSNIKEFVKAQEDQ